MSSRHQVRRNHFDDTYGQFYAVNQHLAGGAAEAGAVDQLPWEARLRCGLPGGQRIGFGIGLAGSQQGAGTGSAPKRRPLDAAVPR